ncbi:MAG: serine/threonine-protein kinase [Planctomycetota bacterium]|jgi:serine/threonine-protein kinase
MPNDRSTTLTGQRLGAYQLIEKLGQGGMGAVYKARDVSLQRTVAVKVLPAALAADGTYVKRFVREARALARLSHPNLVHIYHVGHKEGLYYFAMEYVRGRNLFGRVRGGGPLPIGEFLRVGGQVLAALQKIHSVGMTHRDVKSSNVIIEEGSGRAVLMDFGLAKDRSGSEDEPALTSAGMVLGPPEYMSPEQAEGREVDARSDVYSFGIMAYEMLCGAVPFKGKSAIAVLRKQIDEPPPSILENRPELPVELESSVHRALAKVPDERYGSASAMAADLIQLGHTPELAELAATSLPATARTIIAAPASGPAAPGAPTDPTMRHPSARRGLGGRKLAAVIGAAVLLGVLLALLFFGPRGGDGNGVKPPNGNGGTEPVPPPPVEPGKTGHLFRKDGPTVRVRIIAISGCVATVQEYAPDGREVGEPKDIELRPGDRFEEERSEESGGGSTE